MIHFPDEKNRLTIALGTIVLIGFLSIGITAFVASRDAIRTGIAQQALPLTADNIYSEIQKDLLRPVFISSMMAQDTFVREWLMGGERDTSQIMRYLNEIRTKYGTNTSFLVSERSRKYYFEGGVLKTVSTQDSRDKWYFRIRGIQSPYESNVDLDEANRDQLTVFINYRLMDYHGNFIGVTGVGLTLDQIGKHIDRYQSTFNRRIYFIDRNGRIILTGQSMKGIKGSIRDIPGIASITDRILSGGGTPQQLEYQDGQSLVMVNSRFIPELNSFLLVEQNERENLKGVLSVLISNMVIGAILALLTLVLARRALNRYQHQLDAITHETMTYIVKEKEMAQEQQEFIAMVSHEFRTPLAIIDSSLQGLKRHEDGMPREVSARYGRIRRATLRLQELISNYIADDRLKHSRFQQGAENVEIIHLATRVAELAEWPNMIIETQGLSMHVRGDTELLRIAFSNIINNAIKYSAENAVIRLECHRENNTVEIRISDSGSGIAPADLPRIFDKHYRAANNTASGTGLGLYLVKRIIELHGGTVSAESTLGQGTRVHIRLPFVDIDK